MKIIKESKWVKATTIKGKEILVKTVWEQEKSGKVYTRRIALVKKAG